MLNNTIAADLRVVSIWIEGENGKTGEQENGRTGERENGRTGERENGRMGEWENGRTGERDKTEKEKEKGVEKCYQQSAGKEDWFCDNVS
jgi:hypothetical protein